VFVSPLVCLSPKWTHSKFLGAMIISQNLIVADIECREILQGGNPLR
jgi:hypothetical protein